MTKTLSLDNLPSDVSDYERSRAESAVEHGFACFAVRPEGETPGFVYTVGLPQHGLCDLLLFFPGMDPELAVGAVCNVAKGLMESAERFGGMPTLKYFCNNPLQVKEPNVVYHPHFVRGNDFRECLKYYTTRSWYLRDVFGTPKGFVELRHDDVPTVNSLLRNRLARSLAM